MDNSPSDSSDGSFEPPSTHAPERNFIFGPNGLRAGWSAAIYVVVLVCLLTGASFVAPMFAPRLHEATSDFKGSELHPFLMTITEAFLLIAVLVATAIMARFENRTVAFYGLAGSHRLRSFLIGILCGFGFLSLLIGILVATHHLQLSMMQMPRIVALSYGATWGVVFLLVGITEELMLRGYLLFTLARGIRFWPAAVVLAMLFGWLHKGNGGESPFGLVAASLVALVFSFSLWRLGHLWWAIGFHMSWDWAESFFYGTADSGTVSAGRLMHAHSSGSSMLSGGATGPEGSVWVLLVLALAALFVLATQPNGRHFILK